MCGIVGYIGGNDASSILYRGLKQLEYRGYDSVGIAILNEKHRIQIEKKQGCVDTIKGCLTSLKGNIGIGHTRWATHGCPSDINAHPHQKNRFAVVHNGIIENFQDIKNTFIEKGYRFSSDTDSEVIAWLLDKNYDGSFSSTIKKTVDMLEGSYAIAVICEDFPDTLAVARKNNPLVVGIGDNESFIASDSPALSNSAKDIYVMKDNEIGILTAGNVVFYNNELEKINKPTINVSIEMNEIEDVDRGFYMHKEIREIPATLSDTYNNFFNNCDIEGFKNIVKKINRVTIVGCGTAYHSGIVGKYYIENMAKIPVRVEIASEFIYSNPILSDDELIIAVSQSGETADTISAAELAKAKGLPLVVITNVFYSSITNLADFVFPTYAGTEVAVAATKTYSAQLEMFYLLALQMMQAKLGVDIEDKKEQLLKLPSLCQEVIKSNGHYKKLAKRFKDNSSVFFLGRQLDYAVALEGSLKLKEISYIHSEGYAAGELKHGTIALIDENALVVALLTQSAIKDKTVNAIEQVIARKGNVVVFTSIPSMMNIERVCESFLLPELDEMLMPIISVIPLFCFAYEVSMLKGVNPDKPKNLAKSVTVE